MRPTTRVGLWTLTMSGFSILDATTTGTGFINQTITLPLWALLLFILLPGEAFADLGRTAVKRLDSQIDDGR